jgi:hypothetical protein
MRPRLNVIMDENIRANMLEISGVRSADKDVPPFFSVKMAAWSAVIEAVDQVVALQSVKREIMGRGA